MTNQALPSGDVRVKLEWHARVRKCESDGVRGGKGFPSLSAACYSNGEDTGRLTLTLQLLKIWFN